MAVIERHDLNGGSPEKETEGRASLLSKFLGNRATSKFKEFWSHTTLRNVSIAGVAVAGFFMPHGMLDYTAHRFGSESVDSATTTFRESYLNSLSTAVVDNVKHKVNSQLPSFMRDNASAFQGEINSAVNSATNTAIEKIETELGVDLNHDGYIGAPPHQPPTAANSHSITAPPESTTTTVPHQTGH